MNFHTRIGSTWEDSLLAVLGSRGLDNSLLAELSWKICGFTGACGHKAGKIVFLRADEIIVFLLLIVCAIS